MKKFLSVLFASVIIAACTGGYSFTGGDVGGAKTITIKQFPNYAPLINPTLSQEFTEGLRDIFINRTDLVAESEGGDLIFEGSIQDYRIQYISAQANETSAQNRLTITVNVVFTNQLEPDKSFESKFSRFKDYDSDQSLSEVEASLVSEMVEELAEDIFNRSVVNW
ncbi:MAG: LptE family protein [Schleiferiaceae bacterium]